MPWSRDANGVLDAAEPRQGVPPSLPSSPSVLAGAGDAKLCEPRTMAAIREIPTLPWFTEVGEILFTGETCPSTYFSLPEILVLAGGAILPAAAVPASTRISARMK